MRGAAKLAAVIAILAALIHCPGGSRAEDNRATFIVKGENLIAPIHPVTIAIELRQRGKHGAAALAKGDVLRCKPFTLVDRVIATDKTTHAVHQMALECDGAVWVLKGIRFEK